MTLSVVFIHPCGVFGGASRSLLELINAFPPDSIKPYLLTQRGNVVEFFVESGVPVIDVKGISQFDNTQYGFYRGFRWLILLREFYYVPFTIWGMLKAKSQWQNIDLVHVNEITMLLPILLAKFIFRRPLVVHVRSVQRDESNSLRGRLCMNILRRFADEVIAIDQTVRNWLPSSMNVKIIHNGFRRGDETLAGFRRRPETSVKFDNRPLKIGFVGNFLRFKGAVEFVHAARICADRELDAEFIVVGAVPRDHPGYVSYLLKVLNLYDNLGESLTQYVTRHNLQNYVKFLGFKKCVGEVFNELDVICFPSYLNAVGRPVIEAAVSGVPSIVAISNPEPDTMIHGQTGLCIKEKSVEELADAVEYYYRNREEISRMGEAAYRLAQKNFDIERNAKKVLNIYQSCLQG